MKNWKVMAKVADGNGNKIFLFFHNAKQEYVIQYRSPYGARVATRRTHDWETAHYIFSCDKKRATA